MNIIEELQNLIHRVEDKEVSPDSKYLEALEFYANEYNWTAGGDSFNPTPAPVALDKGKLAREALGLALPKTPSKKEVKIKNKKPVKDTKTKKKSKELDDDKAKRKPVDYVMAECKCGSKEKIPKMLMMSKISDDGSTLVESYKCAKCIRNRVE